MADNDCLFCRIAAGEIPSKEVYSTDDVYAFLDVSPWQTGHTLVIPRRHVIDAIAEPTVLAEVSEAVAIVGNRLRERLGATACNILTNAGADSGQEIFHAHVHVIPRFPDSPGIANLRGQADADLDAVHRRITG